MIRVNSQLTYKKGKSSKNTFISNETWQQYNNLFNEYSKGKIYIDKNAQAVANGGGIRF